MTEKELMDKIKGEEKWLINAMHEDITFMYQYNIEIAFDAVRHYVKNYIESQQTEGEN